MVFANIPTPPLLKTPSEPSTVHPSTPSPPIALCARPALCRQLQSEQHPFAELGNFAIACFEFSRRAGAGKLFNGRALRVNDANENSGGLRYATLQAVCER
jgi:hypothetical protein